MKYTPEQKKEYFRQLRENWKRNKAQAENDEDARAKWQAIQAESPEYRTSYYGFAYTLYAMREAKLDGLPYIDAKTFNGWRASGFRVMKGEKAIVHGITWKRAKNKDEDENKDAPIYPKSYALFHKSQVQAI